MHPTIYTANSNLAGIIDGRDGMESRAFGYDAHNRLTTITGTPGSIGNESFTYDTLDNVRRAVAGGADWRFHYNATTLRLSQITTINSPIVMDYAWSDRGELASRARTIPGSPPIGPDVIFLHGFAGAAEGSGTDDDCDGGVCCGKTLRLGQGRTIARLGSLKIPAQGTDRVTYQKPNVAKIATSTNVTPIPRIQRSCFEQAPQAAASSNE